MQDFKYLTEWAARAGLSVKPEYSVPEVARIIGRDRKTISNWCKSKQLISNRIGRLYKIPAHGVEQLLARGCWRTR